jgi:hypothetical protein
MSPEAIQEHLRQQPFEPFRIFVSDGASYDVCHPEMMLVSRRKIIIALPKPGEEVARTVVYCDPLHITRIEPINGSNTSRQAKKRQ